MALGTENPHVFVPGNHSGFADLVPGNPATVDPPESSTPSTNEAEEGLARATDLRVRDHRPVHDIPERRESAAAVTEPLAVPAGDSVTLEVGGDLPRGGLHGLPRGRRKQQMVAGRHGLNAAVGHAARQQLGEPASTTNVTGGGEIQQTFTDTGVAGTEEPAWTPPTIENAVESPWEQNPYFIPALEAVGITAVGDDASKGYPNPPTDEFGIGANYTGAEYPAGGNVPRRNGAGRATPPDQHLLQRLDRGAGGRRVQHSLHVGCPRAAQCVASSTTTCEKKPANFAEIVNSIVSGMFEKMMNNDPRPSYVHQTNLMGEPPRRAGDDRCTPPEHARKTRPATVCSTRY